MNHYDQILHALARVQANPEHLAELIRQLSEEEWDALLRRAAEAELAPLLHCQLQKLDGVPVPESARRALRTHYLETTARNIVLQGELVKLLGAFREAEIAAIVLKGAALINGVYPNIGMRPMSDLDLLIHRQDLPRLRALAESFGYEKDTAEDLAEGYGEEFRSELTLIHRKSGLRVELHWQLLNFGDETESLRQVWAGAQTQSFDGVEALVLRPEHLVLYLIEHLAYHHNMDGLLRYCDIAEVIRKHRDEMDWAELQRLARRSRSLIPARLALRYVADRLDAPVPAEALAALESARPSLADRLFFRAATNEGFANAARALLDFLAIRGVGPKARFVIRKLFPSRKTLLERWPQRHPLFVYWLYPRRWCGMLWKGVRGLFVLVRRSRTRPR